MDKDVKSFIDSLNKFSNKFIDNLNKFIDIDNLNKLQKIFLLISIGFLIMAIIALTLKVNFSPQQKNTSPLEDLIEGFSYINSHSIFK